MFALEWLTSAEQELAAIYLAARDRQAVTEAVDRLDGALQSDPTSVGEGRSEGRRIVFVRPLGVTFRVLDGERRVIVSRVWRIR